jgi:broad specificity phosphatase PhoE
MFWRKFIRKKINKIFTSPVGRCIQTAEFITKGYGSLSRNN